MRWTKPFRKRIRLGPPSSPRRVIFSHSLPPRNVRDLAMWTMTDAPRISPLCAVATLSSGGTSERPNNAFSMNYKHLKLWGFAGCARTSVGARPMVRPDGTVHSSGYRFLWIPITGRSASRGWKSADST